MFSHLLNQYIHDCPTLLCDQINMSEVKQTLYSMCILIGRSLWRWASRWDIWDLKSDSTQLRGSAVLKRAVSGGSMLKVLGYDQNCDSNLAEWKSQVQ